jgi:hypothetical protein
MSKGVVFSLQLNYIMDYDESNEIDFPYQIFQGYKIINNDYNPIKVEPKLDKLRDPFPSLSSHFRFFRPIKSIPNLCLIMVRTQEWLREITVLNLGPIVTTFGPPSPLVPLKVNNN